MALYSKVDLGLGKEASLEEAKPGLWDSIKGAWDETMATNPGTSMGHLLMGHGDFNQAFGGDEDIFREAREWLESQEAMPLEAQRERIKEAGLEGQLEPRERYTEGALETVIAAKKEENFNALLSDRAPGWHKIFTLGTGLVAGMTDPVNLASAFVPVPGLGEARALSLLGKASKKAMLTGKNKLLARAAVRAGEGAVKGAAGAAMLEPLVYAGQSEIQADYSMANSLMNVGFGAVLGGVLHSGLGALGDWRHMRKGWALTGEYVPTMEMSAELRRLHADKIFNVYNEHVGWLSEEERAASDIAALTEEGRRERAEAAALMYDQSARNWAYYQQEPVENFYRRFELDYQTGELVDREAKGAAADRLFMAMYRNKAKSAEEFVESLEELRKKYKERSYYDFQGRKISRPGEGLDGYAVFLDEDRGRHIKKRHPDFNEWEKIPDVIESGERTDLGIDPLYSLPASVYAVQDGRKITAVIVTKVDRSRNGKFFRISTAFNGSKKGFDDWLAQNKNAATSRGAGGSPANPSSLERSHVSDSGEEKIAGEAGGVKENLDSLEQKAWHGSPHRFRKFSLRHMGKGEGAQVHGWGLYFAGDKDVATGYRVRLGGAGYTYKDKPLFEMLEELYEQGENTKAQVIEDFMVKHDADKLAESMHDPEALKWFREKIHPKLKGEGRLYEVEIPEEYEMLHEGKSLAEQPEEVKAALMRAADDMPDDENWASMSDYIHDVMEDKMEITGRELYETLSVLGTKNYEQRLEVTSQGKKSASMFLNNYGIKGISYVGREDGQCYVVFDDKAIKVRDTLYQAKEYEEGGRGEKTLADRFAGMDFVEADTEKYFGEGKAISLEGSINRSKLVKYAKSAFGAGKIFINEDTGYEVLVSVKSIRNTVNHGLNEVKALSVPFIPDIIRSGIYINTFEKTEILNSHIFANKLRINGKDYVVGFVVREDVNGKRFYDHEMTEIIDPDSFKHVLEPAKEARRISGNRTNQGQVIELLRDALGVKDGSGKILFQAGKTLSGDSTEIVGTHGADKARYEVWELDRVIASHDPANQFHRRKDYPAIAQERPYHSDVGEQQKVTGNVSDYNAAFVLNTDSTAQNGPPIVTEEGFVLGGNSRAMTLQLLYAAGRDGPYREMLAARAAQFGIKAAGLEAFERPVLVRVVEGGLDDNELARRSREYNQTTTQALKTEAEAISRGRMISQKSLNLIAEGIEAEGSLGKYLITGESRELVESLVEDQVIQKTEYSNFTRDRDGLLNDEGKVLVTRVLRGLAAPDYDVISVLPERVGKKLDRAAPAMVRMRALGGDWDLSGALVWALDVVNEARLNKKAVSLHLSQRKLMDANEVPTVVKVLALTMDNATEAEVRTRFEIFANEARRESTEQLGLMGGRRKTPAEVFRLAFLEDAAYVGKQVFTKFNPEGSDLNRAIAWAAKNCGKKATSDMAVEKASKKLESKKLKDEGTRAELQNVISSFSHTSGTLGYYKVNLGDYFKFEEGMSLEIPRGNERLRMKTSGEDAPLNAAPEEAESKAPEASEATAEAIEARGSVDFSEDGKALVTLFKSADLSTVPHELAHVTRRQLAMAAREGGEAFREHWRHVCEFVGAGENQRWTVAMEEKFARAMERYLWEGVAPSPQLEGAFGIMKEDLREIYEDAEAAGLKINPRMQETFARIYSLPFEEGEANFRKAVRELAEREWEKDFVAEGGKEREALWREAREAEDVEGMEKLANEDGEVLRRQTEQLLELDEEGVRTQVEMARQELEILEGEMKKRRDFGDMLMDYAQCLAMGGE